MGSTGQKKRQFKLSGISVFLKKKTIIRMWWFMFQKPRVFGLKI
jgi:hypothetical protein